MESPQVEALRAIWVVYGSLGVAAVAAVVGLFFLIRFFATKFLDARIAEKLESHKHAQQIDIEGLKFRINNLADRAAKAYVKEFEHLPNVWISLNEAYRSARYATGGVRQYADLNAANAKDLETFLANSDLLDWQKERINHTTDKTKTYINFIDRRTFQIAMDNHREFRMNIDKFAIFFSKEIKSDLEKFADLLWSALIEYEIYDLDRLEGVKPERKARADLRNNGQARLEELEQKIRERLWNADSAAL